MEKMVIHGMKLLVRHIERSLLDEDEEVISGGPRVYIAKKELQELEGHINYASFILAAGADIPPRIGDWISEAQTTAFCLADQIDMYAIQGCSYSQLYHMKYDIGMRRIRELTAEVKRHKSVDERHIPDEVVRRIMPLLSEMSHSIIHHTRHVPEDAKIRRDEKIKEIESFLTGPHPVLFITGRQGSGKTTLMKDVYDSQKQKMETLERKGKQKLQVEQEKDLGVISQPIGGGMYCGFNQFCWVDIAETRSLIDLLKMVIKEANINCESADDFEIINRVRDTFKDIYCLIVLDNVQNTSVLYSLMTILTNFKWKIICLTRRNTQKDKNQDVLCISGLEEYDSFRLFLSAAFCNFKSLTDFPRENFSTTVRDGVLREAITWKHSSTTSSMCVPELEEMVNLLDKILFRCQDNPWNIWSIGTLLDANPVGKWKEISERIDSMLIDGNKLYEKRDPPMQLEDAKLIDATTRQCFLYCLAFPEASDIRQDSGGIPTRKLIRLWTAEGYVQHSQTQSQEQEAECMLEKLIKKNLLVVKKKSFDGEVLKCSVNEHLRPLAKKMCERQKFCKVVVDDAYEASSQSGMTKCFPISPNIFFRQKKPLSDRYRMLAVHGDRGVKEVSKTLGKDIRLRSLLYFRTGRIEHSELELSFRRTYKLLRTLELQGARLAKLPSKIDCLVCLRYLGLRNTQLENLPSTLQRLTHLMCLDIRDTNVSEVADVSQFREMRHLYLTNSFRGHSVVIRNGLQSLSELQTLSGAAYVESSVRESSGMVPFEQEISELRLLRKLSMKNTSRASSKNICDAINGIKYLQSLAISCDRVRDGQEFDLSALEIGKNLRKLKLGGPMASFRDVVPFMHSITFLYLWDSKLSIDLLDTLQDLNNLLVLSLLNASTSKTMTCPSGYKKLKRLSIISMENLSECQFNGESMAKLEELVFGNCGNLRNPPRRLHRLASLREVHLTGMPPGFCNEAKDKLKDKVYILQDAHSHGVPSRAATGGGS